MAFNSPQEVLEALVHAYYDERNIETTLACVTDNIEWVGTENDDSAKGKKELRKLLEADISAFPSPLEIELDDPNVQTFGSDFVVITITGKQVAVSGVIYGIRGTVVCVRTEQGWLIGNVHTSVQTKVSDEVKRLMENEKQLQQLMDNVPVGIGIYEVNNGRVTQNYMNEAFYRMLGTNRESREQYFGENTLSAAHPDDIASIQDAVKKLLAGESSITVIYRLKLHDDSLFWVNLTGTVVERRANYIKIYAVFADFNKIKHSQKDEEDIRTTLSLAMQVAKVLTWKYDCRNNCLTDTLTLGEAFHLPKVVENLPESVIALEYIAEESLEDFRNFFTRLSTKTPVSVDTKAVLDNEGNYVWYRIVDTPVYDSEGNYTGSIGTALDITELKEQEQLYEEQLRLNQISAQDALSKVYINLSNNQIISYDHLEPEFQHHESIKSADELLGNIAKDVSDENELKKFESVANCESIIRSFRNGTSHIEVICRIDQNSRWIKVIYDVLKNPYSGDIEMISSIHDVTEQIREELVAHKLLNIDYKTILLIDTVTGIGRSFKQEEADDSMEEINREIEESGNIEEGLKAFFWAHSLPDKLEDVIHENSMDTIQRALEKAPFYECMCTLKEKDTFAQYKVIYSYLENDKRFLLSAVQDVTQLYEKEMKQKNELSIALAKADAANKAKTAFLSRVSHDMRTPLNGILGLTTLLKDSIVDEKADKDLSDLEMSGKYLLNLINDILDVSRIESGKLKLQPIVCNARTMFNNILGLVKQSTDAKNIKLNVITDGISFTTLYIDVARIQQVIMNVLSNAVKFTPEHGQIDVIMTNLSVANGVITDKIEIRDTGIGMSKEFLSHVFEPFEQEDITRTSSTNGTGLGMAITKQLVKLMNGDIFVESEQGKGSCFTIILKLDVASEHQIEEWKKDQLYVNDNMILQGKHILMCEDHPLNTQIATRLLEKKGIIVEHASNGQIGVEMFMQSVSNYYDAILMDIRMPIMDGLDAARAIRNLPRRDARLIPIIAMTANAFAEDIKQTKNAGMDAHLSKPIEKDVLYHTLADFMKINRNIQKIKVLIVDDIELNRAVVRLSLEQDYEILEAESGKQAVEIIKNTKGLDAVITDIQMPEMDGVELIRWIRSDPKYRHLVIVANTQFGDLEQEEKLLTLGANEFIYKPTSPKIIEIRVRNVLRRI